MSEYITVENLIKSYKGKKVIDGISFRLYKGKLLAILGPPGSGKTTLLKIIAGLERQDSGHVYINGKVVDEVPPYERKIAMVFETLALYPHLTVYENIASPLLSEKKERKYVDDRVREIAKMLKIEHLLSRKADKLSGGERQRVALARAITKEADIYLFDEPFANLDAKIKYSLRTEFKKLKEALGKTIILATSDPLDVLALGDEVIVLENGRIIQSGSPLELYERPIKIGLARYLTGRVINELPLVKDVARNEWHAGVSEASSSEVTISPEIKSYLNKFNHTRVVVVSHTHTSRINEKITDCGGVMIKGRYVGFEYRGSEYMVFASFGDKIFSSLSTNVINVDVGSSVDVCFDKVLLYDVDTGDLLG